MTHNSHAGAQKRKVNGGWEFKREEEKRIRSMSPLPEAVAIQDLLEQLSDAGSGTDADEASESGTSLTYLQSSRHWDKLQLSPPHRSPHHHLS